MSYTLDELQRDCTRALASEDGAESPEMLEAVADCIRRACADKAFIQAHFGRDNEAERRILFEHPERGFCIISHVYDGAKSSNPHDHGPSWAIYGQVSGETTMSDFEIVTPPADGKPGKARRTNMYTLKPGDAHVYPTGVLHAPERYGQTRLLRVEGMNMDSIVRDKYEIS